MKAYTFAHWHEFKGMVWFTPEFIAQIPDEFIPGRALQQLNDTSVAEGGAGRNRRNSVSVKEILGIKE